MIITLERVFLYLISQYPVIIFSTYLHVYNGTNQNFVTIPNGIGVDVEGIYLDRNSIRNISSGEFGRFGSVLTIVLAQNLLHTVDPDAFDGTPLQNLSLRNNMLAEVPDFNIHTLIELDLSANDIQYLSSGNFDGLVHLEVLILTGNHEFAWCDSVQEFMVLGPSLRSLELDETNGTG